MLCGEIDQLPTGTSLCDVDKRLAAYVTTGNAATTHAYVYGADLSGTLGGAGGIGGLVAELRFTNYDLRFGSEGTTTTRRREDDLQFTNYNSQFGGKL